MSANHWQDNSDETISKLLVSVRFVSVSLVLAVFISIVVELFAKDTIFAYSAVPFSIALWGGIVVLCWRVYGVFMALLAGVIGAIYPYGGIVFLLLGYSRAAAYLKARGVKMKFI